MRGREKSRMTLLISATENRIVIEMGKLRGKFSWRESRVFFGLLDARAEMSRGHLIT